MKKLKTIVLLVWALTGCEELDRPNVNQFVVEAFITADETVHNIKVKQTASLNDTEVLDVPITDANVRLITNGEEVLLSYDAVSEKYLDLSGEFDVQIASDYQIEIEVDGVTATASTVVPEKPIDVGLSGQTLTIPPLIFGFQLREQIAALFEEERLTLSWEAVPGRAYFVVIENRVETLQPILPSGIPEQSVELLSSFRFISEPSEFNSFEIIGVALATYGPHVAKVYSVNQEYVDLFNTETQDSRDLNEPPSNILNGLGIFTAFAVDSVAFEVVKN